MDLRQREIAREYRDAGLSVVPLMLDGSKRPAIQSWKEYQERLATDCEIDRWWASPRGIGLATGVVSGGLEVLDFDEPSIFPAWESLIPKRMQGWLVVIETGGGGWQVYYRCSEVCGNSKIAMDVSPGWAGKDGIRHPAKASSVRIETRGQGGYVVAPGSPASVHKSGRPYVQVLGPTLPEIPTITADERRELWEISRRFDLRSDCHEHYVNKRCSELKEQERQRLGVVHASDTPWESLDRIAPWQAILEPAGWTSFDGIHWKRPGKDDVGFSAVIRTADSGCRVLVTFSTNAGLLAPLGTSESRTLGAFEAFKLLYHDGDGKAAARDAGRLIGGAK